jgi:hypothetical protein
MTYTRPGGTQARSTVFSLEVCDTQMAACTSARLNLSTLLVRMEAGSAKPKREWSVKTTRRPMVRACRAASCASVEKAWCAWTRVRRSRRSTRRRAAKPPNTVGRVSLW